MDNNSKFILLLHDYYCNGCKKIGRPTIESYVSLGTMDKIKLTFHFQKVCREYGLHEARKVLLERGKYFVAERRQGLKLSSWL